MARPLFVVMMFLTATTTFAASNWKKGYFGATTPGSWARYEDASPGMKMTTTMTRLSDDGGSPRISVEMKFANNQYPSMTNEYTLPAGYPVASELLDYMSHAIAGRTSSGGGEPQNLDANTVATIAKSSPTYGPFVTFKGTETVAGKKCDRYSYSTSLKVPGAPSRDEGDIWVSDAVPFGVVKQSSKIKDANGKVTSSFDRTLVASGKGETEAATKTAAAPPPAAKAASATLKAAFDGGLIRIKATVVPGSKDGEKVHLLIEAKDEQHLHLTVPKGRTSLHVDIPLGDFTFDVPAEKTFDLSSEKSGELDVIQTGQKRALEGHFEISVYEGTPLWSGSATVGFVKK